MDHIHFTAPPGYAKALEDMGHDNRMNRSKQIVAMLAPAVESYLTKHREACRAGKRMPKKKP